MARHGVDVAAVAPPVVGILNGIAEFEVVDFVGVADLLGPGPGGIDQQAPAVFL